MKIGSMLHYHISFKLLWIFYFLLCDKSSYWKGGKIKIMRRFSFTGFIGTWSMMRSFQFLLFTFHLMKPSFIKGLLGTDVVATIFNYRWSWFKAGLDIEKGEINSGKCKNPWTIYKHWPVAIHCITYIQ